MKDEFVPKPLRNIDSIRELLERNGTTVSICGSLPMSHCLDTYKGCSSCILNKPDIMLGMNAIDALLTVGLITKVQALSLTFDCK